MINPGRSKYKKETKKYIKDGIFDIIDIPACLKKNKFITKIDDSAFIYKAENKNYKIVGNPSDTNEIFAKINENKFKFKIEDIILEYNNGYKIKLVEKFIPIEILGEGAFSTVIKAIDKVNKMVIAIKIIVKSYYQNKYMDSFYERETAIHLKLDHQNIVKLYDVLDNKEYLFMFIELMNGGSLRDLIIDRYNDNNKHYIFQDHECATILKGILEGVNYLHSKEIMHRDLKPGII